MENPAPMLRTEFIFFLLFAIGVASSQPHTAITKTENSKIEIVDSLQRIENVLDKKIDSRFDSLSKIYQFHSIEESNYRAIIDNLGSAYAPISVITAMLGLIVGILGIIAAFGIYLIGLRKDKAVKEVIEAKHSEIDRVIVELKESQKKELAEGVKYIKDEEEKRNKIVGEYQAYLKQRLEELKAELSKTQADNKVRLQAQIDDIHEKMFKAPFTYSYGTSGAPGSTGTMSDFVNSAYAASVAQSQSPIVCQVCGTINTGGLMGVYAGISKCKKCGNLLKI